MSRQQKGARLYLRSPRYDACGKLKDAARWVIRDGGNEISTGCGADARAEAERRLSAFIAGKYAPARRERSLSEIKIADVISIYLEDVVPNLSNPKAYAGRAERLLEYFGTKTLDYITGKTCREYVESRDGKGHAEKEKGGKKSTGGGALRDLQDLRSAINHHLTQGYHREIVRVFMPSRAKARQRWMTRDELAKLLWVCWKTREVQEDKETKKFPLRHLCRFLILGIYTGSRPGAVLTAAWDRGPGRSWIDLDNGLFHRHAEGKVETNKRQPSVKIAPRLEAHLRRWKRLDGDRGHVVTFNGKPILSVKVALGRATSVAGIEPATAYSLRHSCASWLVNKGIPTKKVADFLGTSEAMIERHYGHLAPDYQDEAAIAIGRR